MSELGDIEAAVIGVLEAIEVNGEPVFASVAGWSDPDPRRAAAAIVKQRQPAAFVMYAGRGRGGTKDGDIGEPTMAVLIAVRHLGGADAPRLGDGIASGGFDLVGRVLETLDGADVLTDRRLRAMNERVVSADERSVVYEQSYTVEPVGQTTAPTFGGAAIAGTDSVVRVAPGEVAVEAVEFAFPGIDGVFRHSACRRGREILWDGRLLADDDAALNALEATMEGFVGDSRPQAMVDPHGRTYADCVLDSFRRVGVRRRHPVTGRAVQEFEVRFTQLRT